MRKISVREICMLRWIFGKTKKDRKNNVCICYSLEVESIGAKLRDAQFWHAQHRLTMTLVRKNFPTLVDGPSKKIGRPKRAWMKVVRIVLKKCYLSKDLVQDRLEWQNGIHIANLKIVGTGHWWWWGLHSCPFFLRRFHGLALVEFIFYTFLTFIFILKLH